MRYNRAAEYKRRGTVSTVGWLQSDRESIMYYGQSVTNTLLQTENRSTYLLSMRVKLQSSMAKSGATLPATLPANNQCL